ncbi:hypothetical protein GCM10011328_32850 [Hafnia psychrotolerans]|uniref:Uncharacterized protein n=1 Tax=Hafnia psychrotolerans TaxID=1477018 RepID=A0ABQ1H1P0_9GAMM|nr:hypothetical protein GCM10011328_32850 [Hafnia psychrotolerans]
MRCEDKSPVYTVYQNSIGAYEDSIDTDQANGCGVQNKRRYNLAIFLQLNHLRRIKNEDCRGETPAGETQAGPDA